MESEKKLLSYLAEIEKWEKDQKKMFFWEKLSRLPFKLLDKLTPKFVQEKIGQLLSELGNYVQTGGNYLVNQNSVIKYIQKNTGKEIQSMEDVKNLTISDMVKLSEKLQDKRTKMATVQGASTGVGGVFTLVVDIPVILGLALKTLQEIALIHGYSPNEKNERVFIVKCLQFAFSDVVGKEAILNELASFHKDNTSSQEMISQLKGWQEVFYTYADQFGWKKLFQIIPIAGIIFGAFTNRSMMKDVSEAGIMLYRKRRIFEKLKEID